MSFLLGGYIGDCVVDQFAITSTAGAGSPVICGTNTGYHSKIKLNEVIERVVSNVLV